MFYLRFLERVAIRKLGHEICRRYRLDQIINALEKRTFGGGGNIYSVNIRFQEIKKFRKALKLSGELG